TRALEQLFEIEGDSLDLDAEGAGVLDLPVHGGGMEQRLGRNASPVRADSAQALAFDQRGAQAQLRPADGGNVAARAAPDHQQVEHGSAHAATAPGRGSAAKHASGPATRGPAGWRANASTRS